MPSQGGERAEEDPLAIFSDSSSSYSWIGPLGSFITGPVLSEVAHSRTLEELAGSVRRSGASLLGMLGDVVPVSVGEKCFWI